MKLLESLRDRALAKLPEPPNPPFHFRVGWASSYDALFENAVEVSNEDSLLSMAVATGRVLLCGRGGSAKTVLMNRLVSSAAKCGFLPIKVDLKLWSGKDVERWRSPEADHTSRFAQLIEGSSMDMTLPLFATLPANVIRVFFLDGLNELQSAIGEQIIQVLDSAVTDQLGTRVLVSDRLVRRDLRAPHRWKLATVLPLTEDEVRQQISGHADLMRLYDAATPEERELWSSPFFLNAFLKSGETGENKSSTFASFLSKVPLSQEEQASLSEVAFELYRDYASRTFPRQDLIDAITPEVFQRLTHAGILTDEGDKAYFSHHLTHDYLAASFFRTRPEKWNQSNFDVISFSASSFDSLAMVLEQIESVDSAETFIRELYDWNPYAAAYCIAEQKTDRLLSQEMRVVVLSMMAERKFDLIDATARRATDALYLSSGEFAEKLRATSSVEGVFKLVRQVNSQQELFNQWRTIFTSPRSSRLEMATVRQVQSKNSVLGWTISNVLKRTRVSSDQLDYARSLITHRTPVVRWRAVHVLGAFPSSKDSKLLCEVLDRDGNHWVRFGAVRSLVEMAAMGTSSLRKGIFAAIRTRLGKIASDQGSRRELESVLLVSRVKRRGEWIQFVSDLVRELYDEDLTPGATERFERVVRKFHETYIRRNRITA